MKLIEKLASVLNDQLYFILGLLGSIEIPLRLLIKRRIEKEDSLSIYSLDSNHLIETSLSTCKTRTFYLENSSKNSQISLKYIIYLNE